MRTVNPTWTFSQRERNDLIKAWVLTSVAFAIFLGSSFLVAFVTAGVGFIVHELCHKYAAHRFRVHGEFYANNSMLIMSILFSFMGVLFAAPGAVHIMGRITRRENGIISAAGPASNMVLFFLFFPLMFVSRFEIVGFLGLLINAVLGAFNMIPFMGLDGSKILVWNKPVYFGMVVVAVAQVFFAFSLIS